MDHGQRMEIATNVSRTLLDKYKDDILYIGLYGSTAKGTDMVDSDIDMIVISKTMSSWKAYHLKGVTLWLAFKSVGQINDEFYNVGENWPYEVGQLMYAKALYDPNNFAAAMKERVAKLDKAMFLRSAEQHLDESQEILIKLVHAAQEKDVAAVRFWIPSFLEHTNILIALLNRGWFTYGGPRNILNIKEFKDVPQGYPDWSRALLAINDSKAIAEISRDLWEGCRKFAERHGVRPRQYRDEKDIEL